MVSFTEFKQIDIRVGRIIKVQELPCVEYVTHILKVNLGELGVKTSLANIKKYSQEELINKLVICVVNLPSKKIGENVSEVLVLGTPDDDGECVLIEPDKKTAIVGNHVY